MAKQFGVGKSTVSSVVVDVYQAIIALILPPGVGRSNMVIVSSDRNGIKLDFGCYKLHRTIFHSQVHQWK